MGGLTVTVLGGQNCHSSESKGASADDVVAFVEVILNGHPWRTRDGASFRLRRFVVGTLRPYALLYRCNTNASCTSK